MVNPRGPRIAHATVTVRDGRIAEVRPATPAEHQPGPPRFVVPGLIDLERYRGLAQVIFLVVASLDEDAFGTRFAARAKNAAGRPPHRYIEHLDSILRIQEYLLELAEEEGVPIVDNSVFDDSVVSIIRHVTESLRKRDRFDVSDLF